MNGTVEEAAELLFDNFQCKHEITKEYLETVLESAIRFDKKQEVFTTDNITDTGEIGLFTRISDRLSEIKKYLAVDEAAREELMLTDKKITKDFLDIGIFGFIGYIYKNNKWK